MRHRRFMGAVVPSTLGMLGSVLAVTAFAANTTVYRCLDAHLNVIYTDVPCKEGAPFEVRAGDADPAAVARLERIRDALDQAAVQRISEERRLAAERVVPVPMSRDTAADDTSGYGPYYTYPVGGYGNFTDQRPRRDRDRDRDRVQHHRFASRGGAPPPPYIVPRP